MSSMDRRVVALLAVWALGPVYAGDCVPSGDALAGIYQAQAPQPLGTLRLAADGSFSLQGLPLPAGNAQGCWRRMQDSIELYRPMHGADAVRRVLLPPLSDADLKRVRGPGIDTLEQAVDAGLLPARRLWTRQPAQHGKAVAVALSDSNRDVDVAPGDAKVVMRLASGRQLEGVLDSDGLYQFTKLPDGDALHSIGVTLPTPGEHQRWLDVAGPTMRLYLIEFDSLATGYAEGGGMTLGLQHDGSLRSDFPDDTHFVRKP